MLTIRTNWTFPACPTHARGLTDQAEVEADRAEERGEPVPCRALVRRRATLLTSTPITLTLNGQQLPRFTDVVYDGWRPGPGARVSIGDIGAVFRDTITALLPAPTPTPRPE